MQITYKKTNFEENTAVLEAIEKKVQNLKKYLGENADTAHAYVELAKAVGGQSSGNIWRVEVNLDVQGKRYRGEATTESFENSMDMVVGELAKELRKSRKRGMDMVRRGGAAVKNFIRGFGNGS